MTALIVDDEPLARDAMSHVLSHRKDIDSFESAGDAIEALEKLREHEFGLLMLDISMPELSGLEMVDSLVEMNKPLPSVVFVTAHHEHAVAAFERHAVDYVLKPYTEQRINAAIDAAVRRNQGERAIRLMGIGKGSAQRQTNDRSGRIAVKSQGRILLVNPAEIVSVQADGNYVLLNRGSGSDLLRVSISEAADKLQPFGFIRIHRSTLVNSAFVTTIQPWFTGEYVLTLRDGKEYTVTRKYKQNLASLAEFWIGAEGFAEPK